MSPTSFLLLGIAATSLFGCNSIAGINAPYDRNGAAPATAGTGGPVDATTFEGTWTSAKGSLTLNCVGYPPKTLDDMGTVVISKGTMSDIVAVSDGCELAANVAGNTATILPGQSCSGMGDGETDDFSYNSGTFVIGAD